MFKGSEGDSRETAWRQQTCRLTQTTFCYFMILGKKNYSLLLHVLHTLLVFFFIILSFVFV